MPGLIGLPCKSPWLSWELRARIAGAEHASPKIPGSSRTQGLFRRTCKDGGTGQMGWHGHLDPSEGILFWGLDPRPEPRGRESQTPAIYTPSNSGPRELKINTNKGIIRRGIARMDGKGKASYSARNKAQMLLSSRQCHGGLGCCGAGLGLCATPLLTLPWPSTSA